MASAVALNLRSSPIADPWNKAAIIGTETMNSIAINTETAIGTGMEGIGQIAKSNEAVTPELVVEASLELKADWRKLFAAATDQSLNYFPPQSENGKVLVAPPNDVFEAGIHQWRNSLVAQFIGKIPNFSQFQRLVSILWGKEGSVDVKPAGSNLFILQFSSEQDRNRVLEMGPWHIQNKPIIIRKWKPGLKTLEFNLSKIPVWIHLSKVPLELFTNEGLSYVTSALGTPLYMDRVTANQERLAFAKICVELDATTTIPRTIEVRLQDGSIRSILVDISWVPPHCQHCRVFGHSDKFCVQKPAAPTIKVWQPKKQAEPTQDPIDKTGGSMMMDRGSLPLRLNGEAESTSRYDKLAQHQTGKAGSANRFAILDILDDQDTAEATVDAPEEETTHAQPVITHSPRKVRAAAAGVADLMKQLKTKKKGPIDKGKHKNKVDQVTGGPLPHLP